MTRTESRKSLAYISSSNVFILLKRSYKWQLTEYPQFKSLCSFVNVNDSINIDFYFVMIKHIPESLYTNFYANVISLFCHLLNFFFVIECIFYFLIVLFSLVGYYYFLFDLNQNNY